MACHCHNSFVLFWWASAISPRGPQRHPKVCFMKKTTNLPLSPAPTTRTPSTEDDIPAFSARSSTSASTDDAPVSVIVQYSDVASGIDIVKSPHVCPGSPNRATNVSCASFKRSTRMRMRVSCVFLCLLPVRFAPHDSSRSGSLAGIKRGRIASKFNRDSRRPVI